MRLLRRAYLFFILVGLLLNLSPQEGTAQSSSPGDPRDLQIVGEEAGHVVNHTPTFSWVFVGADGDDEQSAYRCQVENPMGEVLWNSGKVLSSSNTATYGGNPSALLDGQWYTLLVRTWNKEEMVSSWAERSFRMNTPPPAPIQPIPAEGYTVRTYTDEQSIEWTQPADTEGDGITAVLYGDLGLTAPTTQHGSTTRTVGTVSGLTEDGTYYWRVVVSDGYEETQGPVWSFQVDRKGLIGQEHSAPFLVDTRSVPLPPQNLRLPDEKRVDRVVDHQPNFHWDYVVTADNDAQSAYQCQVFADTVVAGTLLWDSGKVLSIQPARRFDGQRTLLKDGAEYIWRVRTWSRLDKVGAWASARFRMNAVSPPPANPRPTVGMIVRTDEKIETAFWDLSSEPDGDPLMVRVVGDLDITVPQTEQELVEGDNSSALLKGITGRGTYYWQVVLSDGYETIEGPVWSFKIRGEEPMARIEQLLVNDSPHDLEAGPAFVAFTDRLAFSGSGTIVGNPSKTIQAHQWTLQRMDQPDAEEQLLSERPAFELDAQDLGRGEYLVLYRVTDSAGNLSDPASVRISVRKDVGRAIIVAGGGYLGENWETFFTYTTNVTHKTYNRLFRQLRYNEEAIEYLNPIPNWGEEYEGLIRIADTEVTPQRFHQAIQHAREHNVRDAIPLVIFLAGHGGEGVFYLSDREVLKAEVLKEWLDELNAEKVQRRNLQGPEEIFAGEVVLVVDFCYSRTFLEKIAGPGRVVVGSSSRSVAAVVEGSSFGGFFFEDVAKGWSVLRSFEEARAQIKALFPQEPYLDADGDGIPLYSEDGRRNPGTEREAQLADAILLGGGAQTLSPLLPEIYRVEVQEEGEGALRLVAVADQNMSLSFKAVPKVFDTQRFADLANSEMAVASTVGDSVWYHAVWQPDTYGTYMLMVRGSDNLGNLVDHRTVVVQIDSSGVKGGEELNHLPELASVGAVQGAEGVRLEVLFSAFDVDGDSLKFGIEELPVGAQLKDSLLVWEPNYDQSGEYELWVVVEDGRGGTASEVVRIQVQDVNRFPTLEVPADTTIDEEQVLDLRIRASDADGDSLIYRFDGLPEGSAFDLRTQEFRWCPEVGQTGIFIMAVRVDDGREGVALDTLKITVRDITPPAFTIGILQNPIATQQLDLYLVPSERLGELPTVEVEDTQLQVVVVDPSVPLYRADYVLMQSGAFSLHAGGTDAAGNQGTGTKVFAAQHISAAKGGVVHSVDGQVSLELPVGGVDSDRFILIQQAGDSSWTSKGVAKAVWSGLEIPKDLAHSPSGDRVYMIGGSGISLRKSAQLIMHYTPANKEERLGIYRLSEGKWQPVTTYINAQQGTATAFVKELGAYQVRRGADAVVGVWPTKNRLLPNYPNPFNAGTQIRYVLSQAGKISLEIYNILGQKVITLIDGYQTPGEHVVSWDGRDENRKAVTSGVYIYSLRSEEEIWVRRMVLLR